MFAFIFAPLVFLWTADNHEFLGHVTDAEWEYVGIHERAPGPQADGSYALTMQSGGKPFIIFKQKPLHKETQLAGIAE